jgi:hypothetical protein
MSDASTQRDRGPTGAAGSSLARMLASLARWLQALIGRIIRAWRVLPTERRLAAVAAVGLFLVLFLPWYQESAFENGNKKLQTASLSHTGWGAFSWVEAAILLVAVGVVTLLIQRAEGKAFHVPGGDGFVVMAAGGWTCVLIVWRIFDKQGTTNHGVVATTSGIEWGIFAALALAGLLTYAGTRIRAAHQPEPPLPGEAPRRGPERAQGPGPPPVPEDPGGRERGPARGAEEPPDQPPTLVRDPSDERTLIVGAPGPATPGAARRARLNRDEQLTIPLDPDEPRH